MRPIRWFVCVVLAVCLPAMPAHAQLETFQTAGLRLIYFNGTETYLVPHAARTFLNSLAFQRRIFGLDPTKPVTVLLVDFSDAGNASATVVPRNNLTVDISPLSYEFETLATNERLNTIMNHEMVHIATMDPPAKRDRMFRRLFGGKVMPLVDDPESIFYFFLTTPRVAAPRWYHEGIAVFMDTWMAGGMGRAQSGYDEMVFRGMVRDGSRFFDPLGLVSAGTKDRLSAPDQFVSVRHAFHDVARSAATRRHSSSPGSRGATDRERTTRLRSSRCSAFRSSRRGRTGLPMKRRSRRQNLKAVNRYPLTPYHDVAPRALGSVSRAYYDPVPPPDLRRIRLPRGCCARGGHSCGRWIGSQDCGCEGTGHLYGDLPCVGSRDQNALLHDRQRRTSRPDGARSGHSSNAPAAEGRANRRPRVQSGRLVAVGHSSPQRHLYDRQDSEAVSAVGAGCDAAVRDRRVRPRRLTGWPLPLGVIRRGHRPAGRSRVRDGCHEKGCTERHHAVRFWRQCAVRICLLAAMVVLSTGARYFTGVSNIFRVRPLVAERQRRQQHRRRLLSPDSARRREAVRLPLFRCGIHSRRNHGHGRSRM